MEKRSVEQIYDEWLVIRCQGGDEKALSELIGRWQRRLNAYVWRLTDGHDDSADIVQEIWVNVIKRLNDLKDPTCFPQWVYRIATARCVDWVRRTKRDRSLRSTVADESDIKEDPPSAETADSKLTKLRAAIRQLPADRRTIISLFYIEELSTNEIAESLGIPIGTVKSRLYSAREILRKTIERSDR
jgi:RNA polymerase sigma-70 factor (ECF subfamily)